MDHREVTMKQYIVMSKDFESVMERLQIEAGIKILDNTTTDVVLVEMEDVFAKKFASKIKDLLIEENIRFKKAKKI